MIKIEKKYTRNGVSGVVLSVTAMAPRPVVWQDCRAIIHLYGAEGECARGSGEEYNLIEVIPDLVTYSPVQSNGRFGEPFETISSLNRHTAWRHLAIARIKIRNAGRGGLTDVVVDIFPPDYMEDN